VISGQLLDEPIVQEHLDQGGVLGHGADQLVVRRLAGEAELGIRGVSGAQQIAARDAQQAQSGSRVYSR
jgi:hypothetical protein